MRTDADAIDASMVDAEMLGPFGTPQRIDVLSSNSPDDDPTLTADLLEIYFNTNRSDPDGDIWFATRSSSTDAWGAPQLLVAASTADKETTPEISPDGLTLWFSSDRPGGRLLDDVYVIRRPSRSEPWSNAQLVAELNTDDTENGAAELPGGLTMALARTPGGDDYDLFFTSRSASNQAWAPPAPITELNTAANDECPHSPDDGATLYYGSERDGNMDIYVAERGTDGAYGPPRRLGELATAARDLDPWVSADERYIVYMSNDDLYEARR